MERREPLSRKLNEAVSVLATRTFPFGFDVKPSASNTWAETRDELAYTGRLSIWAGEYGYHSVFADNEVWRSFRAWHDWVHVRYDFCFSPEGEWGAAALQGLQVLRIFGRGADVVTAVGYAMAEQLFPLERDWGGREPVLDRWSWFRERGLGYWYDAARALAALDCWTEPACIEVARRIGIARTVLT